MFLFNIRSWNSHLEHFVSENIYLTYSSLFYFTEANINNSPAKHINDILDDWKDIHNNTQHGLVLCYNVIKANIIEVIETASVLEVLPIVLELEKEIPGLLGPFIDDFILLIDELSTQYRMLIVGDFNLDQMLTEHVAKFDPLIQSFNLYQHSQYSTHIHGGYWIWYLLLQIPVLLLFLLSPFNDHLVLFFEIWCIIFMQNLAVKNLVFNPHYITHKYSC